MYKNKFNMALVILTICALTNINNENNSLHIYENNNLIQQNGNYKIIEVNDENYLSDNNQLTFQINEISEDFENANMVNYNMTSKTLSYEYFNQESYARRNSVNSPTSLTYSEDNELIQSLDSNYNLYNSIDYSSSLTTEGYIPSDIEWGISPTTIIDDENERTPVANTKVWPYKATVYIESHFKSIKGNDGKIYNVTGTGFMEGPNLLVTAAHCIYGDVTSNGVLDDGIENPRFPDEIKVYAGVNDESEVTENYMYYSEVAVINIQKEYYEAPSFDYDWAACELTTNLGNLTGYYGKIGNWYEQGADVFTYGYPGDKPTATMWEAYGKTVSQTTRRFDYDFDSYSGQSGSPVFVTTDSGNTYVCGIHTAGGAVSNGGTKINSFIFHYLNSFVTNHNFEHQAATIIPTDYGFADAYPTDDATRNNYVTHTLDTGFTFRTRRYRTGYIHNEYVVMSVFRENINEAFIEYNFDTPVTKIDVDLSHWRSLTTEWTYSSNCSAVLRIPNGDGYTIVLDLLADSTNLPTDRTNPTTYTIEFPEPVTTFEFYMHSTQISTNDSNRGRICIGNMNIYTTEGWY